MTHSLPSCEACRSRPPWSTYARLCAECKWERKLACDKKRAATPEGRERERLRSEKRRQDDAYNDEQRLRKAAWKLQNRDHWLATHSAEERKRKYGVTPESFDSMFEAQCGACQICRRVFEGPRAPHVDHCHRSGKVRGLLCTRCNTQVGVLEKLEERGLLDRVCDYVLELSLIHI